jgi:hypothetical protein
MAIDLSLGERELMSMLSDESLSSFEICPGRGLLALLAYRSCKEIMRGTPGLVHIYEDYFRQLVSIISLQKETRPMGMLIQTVEKQDGRRPISVLPLRCSPRIPLGNECLNQDPPASSRGLEGSR